jgi:hypothetical protein
MGRGALWTGCRGCGPVSSAAILTALLQVAKQLTPDALAELVKLVAAALRGAPVSELEEHARRVGHLQLFKASYRRGR